MSVYGSLYSAVSGIRAQGVAIGIISDNISNVNTVGYKAGSQYFGTLVTSSGGGSSYSPGGVRAQNRQLISQQGLVQTTSSPLDIAIQGNGMFVVSTGPDGIGAGESVLYTRAGKFGTDEQGNFINSAGYYLQAWPLDNNGNIPSNSSSLGTLETVNIGEAFGEAAATTRVDMKVNLNSREDVLPGTGQIVKPGSDGTNTENLSVFGDSIIVPNANLGLNFGRTARTAALTAATTAGNTAGNTSIAAGGNAATAAAAAVAAAAGVAQITAVTGAAAAATTAGNAAIASSAAAATAAGTAASTAVTTSGNTAAATSISGGGNSAAAGAAVIAAAIGAAASTASVNTAITTAGNAAIAATAAAATTAGTTAGTAVTTAGATASDTSVAGGGNSAAAAAAILAAAIGVSGTTASVDTAITNASAAAVTASAAAATTAGTTAGTAATTAGNTAAQTSVAGGGNSAAAAAAVIAAATGVSGTTASVDTAITAAGNAAVTASAAAATAAGAAAAVAALTAGGATTLGVDAQTTGDAVRDDIIALPEITAIPGAVAAVTAAANAETAAAVLRGDTPTQARTAVAAAAAAAADIAVAAGTTAAAVVTAVSAAANTGVAAETTAAAVLTAVSTAASTGVAAETTAAAVVTATATAASTGVAANFTVNAAVTAAAAAGANSVQIGTADFDGDALRVRTAGSFSDDFVYGGFTEGANIGGGILGAATATQPFNSGVTTGDAFTIVVNGDTANPRKFTYIPSSPVTEAGEFNSLQTLAAAINNSAGLSARVATVNGNEVRLYVSATDARQAISFAQSSGSTANFPSALGLANVPASSANRWNTMEGLSELVNTQTQGRLKAEVLESTSANAKINIYNADPRGTVQFENFDVNTDALTNTSEIANIVSEFQLNSTLLDPAYNGVAGSTAKSIASGNIKADFERSFTVYDSLGEAHELKVGFVKVGTNSWRAELYAANASEIVSTVTGGDANDRFIAAASVTFDGSGNLASISPNWLTTPPTVRWRSGASTSSIALDLGTIGAKNGMSQSAGLYTSTVTQNGAAVGLLDSVSIDGDGFVVANFNNGQSKKLYKIPIATFANYDGMQTRNGNVFIQTLASGDVNLAESGSGGAGDIQPESVETSNSELSEELTDMIVAQRAYQASAKVITTADELLDELNRIT